MGPSPRWCELRSTTQTVDNCVVFSSSGVLTHRKQYYAPNSNILVTKFLGERAVGAVTDLLVPKGANRGGIQDRAPLPWLIRKVESLQGTVDFRMECAPAFNYCRDTHTTELVQDDSSELAQDGMPHKKKVVFVSKDLELDLRYLASNDGIAPDPEVKLKIEELDGRELLGPSVVSNFSLEEGQCVYFVLRQIPESCSTETRREANAETLRKATDLGIPIGQYRAAVHLLRPADNPLFTVVSTAGGGEFGG